MRVTDDLLDLAIATIGGQALWDSLCGLRIDISIGGPIWAMKGWPPEQTFDQILSVDTVSEHVVFTPFTRPDQQMVFDGATDTVTMQTLDGEPVQTLSPARAGFKGMCETVIGTQHISAISWATRAGTISSPRFYSTTPG
jgi:hypothetical protein